MEFFHEKAGRNNLPGTFIFKDDEKKMPTDYTDYTDFFVFL
jgi:hypothetical protein